MLVGLAFAFALAALFAAVQVAGSLLDTLIGFSFGALVDPLTGTSRRGAQQLYALIGVLIFIAIGGDAWVIQGLARTYEACRCSRGAASARSSRARSSRSRASSRPRSQICAPVLLAADPDRRRVRRRLARRARSSTSSRSASRPR